ncbi:helix-turn-helix transcriptional regulator [Desulfoscipio geothermicus]|uniref:Putative transcriptional regulator n=1 Tax=Desulfoscipio geothermicus DSM 3669 TaxID=1121426 RepID=A0A1I6DDD8_9FIRM|nr:helix-turn-helix domain-containing protein [Desulfoscipio geothermicus]SFR03312.1 putative transcriptional regulator [Desulfoscipio geothermicus DSM 3669]
MKRREKLIALRNNVPRPEIAKQIGITPQMLGMIERGERTPSLLLAKKISDFYGVSVEDIFFEAQRNDLCLDDQAATPEAVNQ